ncbi:MAG: hypothetical protein WBO53_19950, partial [Thermoanaerobaculia bacterium]
VLFSSPKPSALRLGTMASNKGIDNNSLFMKLSFPTETIVADLDGPPPPLAAFFEGFACRVGRIAW